MKKLIFTILALSLTISSIGAHANTIIIKGQPVILERSGEVYNAPVDLTTSNTGEYYFSVDNSQKVCFTQRQPSLTNLNHVYLNVKIGGSTQRLYCYEYLPDYFTVQP